MVKPALISVKGFIWFEFALISLELYMKTLGDKNTTFRGYTDTGFSSYFLSHFNSSSSQITNDMSTVHHIYNLSIYISKILLEGRCFSKSDILYPCGLKGAGS